MTEVIQYTIGMSNGFFIRSGETVIAVDSGGEMGDGPFLDVCRKHGIDPRSIALLVVTHGHVDHFVNMGAMKALTKAPLLCHKLAAPFLWEGLKPDVFGRNALGRAVMARQAIEGDPIPFVPKVEPDILFEGTYDLKPWGIDGKIIETPGHSKCSTAVILDSGQALVGDTIAQPPGASTVGLAFLSDTENSDAVLFDSVERILSAAHTVYSGHGGPFSRDEVMAALLEEKAQQSQTAGAAE
ncbi:MAG TPA: MBL fold metallo-hydrolase [Papillibacter sp.]|jgi:glyoxylase-like metal-dependent hydrolase (beta-lactamase superfamily II)|nr:MBL fold metallo-hydrolase [Papillibacter sp.]